MMTDSERLVWATSYSLVFDRSGDAVAASRAAGFAVSQLREIAPPKNCALKHVDEFLDEIVNVP